MPPSALFADPELSGIPSAETPTLTYEEVAERLGVSVPTVHNRVNAGRLHPVKIKNRVYFSTDEVEREIERIEKDYRTRRGFIGPGVQRTPPASPSLRTAPKNKPVPPISFVSSRSIVSPLPQRKIDGQKASVAFKRYREGATPTDTVIEMAIPPDDAEYLWDMYCKLGRAWVLPAPELVKIRALINWKEDPPSPLGFHQSLQKFIAKELDRQMGEQEKKRFGGEELSADEKAALDEADAEVAARAAMRAKAAAVATTTAATSTEQSAVKE